MNDKDQTFGLVISNARKNKAMSQKELAQMILREDGQPISQQYLNDIEHDRRSPSSDHMIKGFSEVLGIDKDWLYFLVDRLPDDIRKKSSKEEVSEIMAAFRRGSGR